jgi:hypothetical protein
LGLKIGGAIKQFTSAELCQVDVIADPRSMWAKVRQLTGRCSKAGDDAINSTVTAEILNNHYAAMSTDSSYKTPCTKSTVNNRSALNAITEWRIFKVLDGSKRTAAGLNNIPAWFLKIGAPFFAARIANVMNLSLATSTVPMQWKVGSIPPIPKITKPLTPADYRPITITPILSRILERSVVTEYIYPSLQDPPPNLTFSDQFSFQPSTSTTAAIIHLMHTITNLLNFNHCVIVYDLY